MCKKTIWPITFVCFCLSFWGCQNTPQTADPVEGEIDLEALLPGTWEAVSMLVEVNSAEGIPDSNYIFRINDGDWESIFSVSPPRTYFEKDHKFRIEYIDGRDSVMDVDRGIWNTFGDTLMMIQSNVTNQYLVTEGNGLIFFRDVRDWDSDGEEDDNYQEVKRRVSIGTK